MITEDYVSFETAKLLKEKGFGIQSYASIKVFGGNTYEVNGEWINPTKDTIIPTLQMAMKWLREVHYCHIVVDYTFKADAGLTNDYVSYVYGVENAKTFVQHTSGRFFDTYEESCEEAIKYCLENLI